MLDSLDLTLKLGKAEYRERMPLLRSELRDIQHEVRRARIPVVILFEGWDASGKGDSIATLVYPLDPRGFKVYTTGAPTEEERFHPFLWRFWTRLPARGDFVLFDRSWYRRLLEERLEEDLSAKAAAVAAAEIRDFEQQLTDDGTVLVKFWLEIARKEQQRRFKSMAADRYQHWRTTQAEVRQRLNRGRYARAAEEMFELTSTANAPWTLVEATEARFRRVKVFETLLVALRGALQPAAAGGGGTHRAAAAAPDVLDPATRRRARKVTIAGRPTLLDRVDLTKRLERKEYDKKLGRLQQRLRQLCLECYRQRVGAAVVYEGWDAAGKGGNIKRLTQELDPRGYQVISIAAPDTTELAHHYLWRFWRRLPKAGHLGIFDRSWYGRVLVERVEGFAAEPAWRRAYQEINEFERGLTGAGLVLIKFWLQISPEEQLRRFEERETTPYKHYKITAEDWRNRLRWNAYRAAVIEMLERTSTTAAPWTIVEAEDKLWARIKTLTTVVKALEKRLRV